MKRFVTAITLLVLGLGLSPLALAQSGEVVFYNNTSTKLADALAAAFNKKYPNIKVQAITAGTGEQLSRIRAEKANPRGDVAQLTMEAYTSAPELFEPYRSKEHDAFPANAIGPNNLYYGYQLSLQLFIVNTKSMPLTQAPQSWKDLGDPKYKGKIIMAHPALSGNSYAQLAQMLQLYDWGLVKRVIANATIVPKSKLVYLNVAKGEFPIGITEESKVYNEAEKGFPVGAVYPSEGTGMRIEGVAIIKGGPNPENARLFADFMNSQEGQQINVKVRQRRVPRADVKLPKGTPPLDTVKLFDYDARAAGLNRDANLKQFDALLASKK
jgi:iron(III) transport system substrate-binding protein